MGFQAGPQAEEVPYSVAQGVAGAASQAGLAGLDTANGRSMLWDPQDPLLGTPDLVRMLLLLPFFPSSSFSRTCCIHLALLRK